MRKLLFCLLFLAVPLSAEKVYFDPPDPTNRTPVTIAVAGLWVPDCRPASPAVLVQGRTITVTAMVTGSCGPTVPVVSSYRFEVWAGLLEPGTYDVVADLIAGDIRQRVAATKLVVREAGFAPGPNTAIDISPRVVAPGTPSFHIRADFFPPCVLIDPCPVPRIKFNGVEAREYQLIADNEVVVRAPNALAPGNVDVTIESAFTETITNAIRVYDPGADYDPSLFERVLFPVIFNGGGAAGSIWSTDAWIHNSAFYAAISRFRTVEQNIGCVPPNCDTQLRPRETRELDHGDDRPAGFFDHIARGSGEDFHTNVLFRDLSRQAEAFGTELPVVRENDWQTGKTVLLGIPGGPDSRIMIRAYVLENDAEMSGTLPLRVYLINGTEPILEQTLILAAPADKDHEPASASFNIPALPAAIAGPLRIEIGPLSTSFDNRYWAFASITNNRTQHVTLVTPQ
jgi:hypothetical protein